MSKSKQDLVCDLMTHRVITVDITEYVEEALRLMVKFDIGSLVLTDDEKPVRIITERDITKASLRGDNMLRLPVRSLMSKPLVTIPPSLEIWRAFETMLEYGVRRLPVVEDGRLVGIITDRDLIRWVLRVFYEPNLPSEIRALVENPRIEATTGRSRCPDCGQYLGECICFRTAVAVEE